MTNSADAQKKVMENAALAQQAFLSLKNIQESNPTLQANENFKSLMAQLEGSINRVSVERRKLQTVIRDYNKQLVKFPTNVVAGLVGYHVLPFYEASATDQHAPKLNLRD